MIRRIDPKYHIEQDGRIVKTSNGVAIPDDEPLIIFRARDHNALAMLRAYREICVADGCTDYHMDGIDNRIAEFATFKREKPQRMKQPGCTLGK